MGLFDPKRPGLLDANRRTTEENDDDDDMTPQEMTRLSEKMRQSKLKRAILKSMSQEGGLTAEQLLVRRLAAAASSCTQRTHVLAHPS